jgi:hypothetical protein
MVVMDGDQVARIAGTVFGVFIGAALGLLAVVLILRIVVAIGGDVC